MSRKFQSIDFIYPNRDWDFNFELDILAGWYYNRITR